jgi:hypothetical protein
MSRFFGYEGTTVEVKESLLAARAKATPPA